jgi:outer membrane biosynthesis protein TonB
MLGGIGGLLLWKTSSGSQPELPAMRSASAAAVAEVAPAPTLDEAPPPPPPPAEEPAQPSAASSKNGKKSSGDAGTAAAAPCTGECKGSSTPALERQLGGLGRTARHCYDQALENNPGLKGRVTVAVRVGPTGLICAASVASSTLSDPGVGSCVARRFMGAQVAAPQNGCVDAQVPLNFVPDNAR